MLADSGFVYDCGYLFFTYLYQAGAGDLAPSHVPGFAWGSDRQALFVCSLVATACFNGAQTNMESFLQTTSLFKGPGCMFGRHFFDLGMQGGSQRFEVVDFGDWIAGLRQLEVLAGLSS